MSAGWDNKQWLPYTVATTSFQCDDTYAALISLRVVEGGGTLMLCSEQTGFIYVSGIFIVGVIPRRSTC